MEKKSRKIKWKNDVTDRLYKAVLDYVEKNHGTALVIGGIAIVEEGTSKYNYGVMIRCTGKKPAFAK